MISPLGKARAKLKDAIALLNDAVEGTCKECGCPLYDPSDIDAAMNTLHSALQDLDEKSAGGDPRE